MADRRVLLRASDLHEARLTLQYAREALDQVTGALEDAEVALCALDATPVDDVRARASHAAAALAAVRRALGAVDRGRGRG